MGTASWIFFGLACFCAVMGFWAMFLFIGADASNKKLKNIYEGNTFLLKQDQQTIKNLRTELRRSREQRDKQGKTMILWRSRLQNWKSCRDLYLGSEELDDTCAMRFKDFREAEEALIEAMDES